MSTHLRASLNEVNALDDKQSFQEYGDLTIGKLKVAEFQGKVRAPAAPNGRERVSPLLDAVPSGDVPLEILRHKLRKSASNQESSAVQRAIRGIEKVCFLQHFILSVGVYNWNRFNDYSLQQKRQHLKDTLRKIVLKTTKDETKTEFILTERMKLTDFSCYEELVNVFSQRCFNLPKVG